MFELNMITIPIIVVAQLFAWYCMFYVLVWIVAMMFGYNRPKFLFWQNKRKKPLSPVDEFRVALNKMLDEGWTTKEVASVIREQLEHRMK